MSIPEVIQVKKAMISLLAALTVIVGIIFLINSEKAPQDLSGWHEENGVRRYLDEAGTPLTGWQDIGLGRYYFGADGSMVTGWLEEDGCRYYLSQDGSLSSGWRNIDGSTYYLDENGAVSGWMEQDGKTYYFTVDGMVTGWHEIDGTSYYFLHNGTLAEGWTEIDGINFYFLSGSTIATGWQEIDGERYFFTDDGIVYTGWLEDGEYTYYLTEEGPAAVGPTEIDGTTYYFTPKGIQVILVNPWNYMPEDYTVDLKTVTSWYRVSTECYDALMQMLADCEAAGYQPDVRSAYRTQKSQEDLFENKIKRVMKADKTLTEEEATKIAATVVAIPGTSEHQLGLAVDLVDAVYRELTEEQEQTETQQWLMEHCWEYGFILRYPNDKSEITGIIYEPWHYRYVGVEIAMEMRDSGLCLEEYLGAAG